MSEEQRTDQLILDSAVEFIRENPFLSVGIAVGLGYFLGVQRGREITQKVSDAAAGFLMSEGSALLSQLKQK